MVDLTALDEPTFVNLTDVQMALLHASRGLPKATPAELTTLLDETIAGGAIPPKLAVFVRAIWNADKKAPAQLKVVGARLAQFLADTRQGQFGKGGEASRIRLAFLRELGVEGAWPDPADDPARGEVAAA